LQIYYTIPAFVDAIFSAKIDEDVLKASPSKEEKKVDDGVSEQVEKRIKESKKLIFEMKKLFATLITFYKEQKIGLRFNIGK
jgi:hypothetical protein